MAKHVKSLHLSLVTSLFMSSCIVWAQAQTPVQAWEAP